MRCRLYRRHQKNLANTNIMAWGGKVYALYEAGRPVELDPVTLETRGETSLNGKLNPGMFISLGAPRALESRLGLGGQAFTAHPHTDPHAGRVVGWGWKSLVAQRAVEATFWEWDPDWMQQGETRHLLTGCEVRVGRALPSRASHHRAVVLLPVALSSFCRCPARELNDM